VYVGAEASVPHGPLADGAGAAGLADAAWAAANVVPKGNGAAAAKASNLFRMKTSRVLVTLPASRRDIGAGNPQVASLT